MNTDFDTNFEQALKMSQKEFSHYELIALLREGNVAEKQIAALKLDGVNNLSDAEALINNLTGCDGKIREAVALKIHSLLTEKPEISELFNFPEIFADASIDINPNVCRLVVESVQILKKTSAFSEIYLNKILEFTQNAFEELDKFIFRDKKYVINKQLFKLYWCLECLKLFVNDIDEDKLFSILERTSQEREYTIREKAAQILILLESEKFNSLKEKLMNDENYYVRNIFTLKSSKHLQSNPCDRLE